VAIGAWAQADLGKMKKPSRSGRFERLVFLDKKPCQINKSSKHLGAMSGLLIGLIAGITTALTLITAGMDVDLATNNLVIPNSLELGGIF
jgi:hypothetical protein